VTFREFFYDVLVITVLQSVLSYISGRKRPSVLFTVSTVLSQFTRVTDGRTDRQRTDGQTDRRTDRILIAIPRLHSMQRGKK